MSQQILQIRNFLLKTLHGYKNSILKFSNITLKMVYYLLSGKSGILRD